MHTHLTRALKLLAGLVIALIEALLEYLDLFLSHEPNLQTELKTIILINKPIVADVYE